MPRYSAKIEVGDLVQFRSQDKIQKFYDIWNSVGIVTDIYTVEKGKNAGQEMAKVYFSTRQKWTVNTANMYETFPYNKEIKILLKRMKKVRS